MLNDLRGKAVLITGGTKGIGLATGLAFGRIGAMCTLTHRWGSADENDIRRQFKEANAPAPLIVEADASNDDDTANLIKALNDRCDRIEVFVSGVAFGQTVKGVDAYKSGSLLRSMQYSVWPTLKYLQEIRKVFGTYPRYVIGFSSLGSERLAPNYEFVAACKAALESSFRYLSYRLVDEDVRANVIRASYVRTDSLDATLGPAFQPFVDGIDPSYFVTVEDVANAVLALCSGLMDGVTGQVLLIDRGSDFADNLMGIFDRRRTKAATPEEAK